MKPTRFISLLVVLALALAVVTPALANGNTPARLPWREFAQVINWATCAYFHICDPNAWGFFSCGPDGETYWWGFFNGVGWREWPEWLMDEYIDAFEAGTAPSWPDTTGWTFGPCRDGNGVEGGDWGPQP